MLKKHSYILIAIIFFVACQKPEVNQYPLVLDYGYFPLDSGLWKQYDITYIEIDAPSELYDTVRYQLHMENTGWFLNAANDSSMRIELLYRDSSHHSWKPLGVWQASVKGKDAYQIEENIKFLKLKFPTQLNYEWNGNIFNHIDTIAQYSYEITSLDMPESVNSFTFDSVLTVTQKYKSTLVDKVDFFEKYAYGLGLIQKQQIDIRTDDTDPDIPIEDKVTKGTFYYQTLTNYGQK